MKGRKGVDMDVCGWLGKFLLAASLACLCSVPAHAADAVMGSPQDPNAMAGILNEFCRTKMESSGEFSGEDVKKIQESLFSGQYSAMMPSGMSAVPNDVVERFIKEVTRCAVTADTIRLLQSYENKTGAGAK